MDGLARMIYRLRTAFMLQIKQLFATFSTRFCSNFGAIMIKKFKWQDLTFGREITYASEFNDAISENLLILTEKLNALQTAYGKQLKVTSGWRPLGINSKVGGAKSSGHTRGECVDIADADVAFWNFLIANMDLVKKLDLYLEDKRWTPSWVHIGIKPPRSGKRVFIPNSNPPLAPDIWDGKYDD